MTRRTIPPAHGDAGTPADAKQPPAQRRKPRRQRPTSHTIPADVFTAAFEKLKAAKAAEECHICKKPRPDGYTAIPVKVHIACVETARSAIARLMKP